MTRVQCLTCFKPQPLCVCASVPKLSNRTGVHLLQHMRERAHPLGTARLARLGLSARVHVLFSENADGSSAPVALPEGAVLLYPSEHAVELDPANPPPHLVVVDGTWGQAHQLHRDNPWIQALPHVQLTPSAPSRYRIRREPRADYVSTLEAVVEALAIIEADLLGVDELLAAFDGMIDAHLAHRGSGPRVPRHRHERKGRSRAVPWDLVDHPERTVLVHVEPAPFSEPRALLQVSALRLHSGEVLDLFVAGGLPSPDRTLHAMGLRRDQVAQAHPLEHVLSVLQAFIGQQATVLTWRPKHGKWLAAHGMQADDWHVLSAVWRNAMREPPPGVLPPSKVQALGRAGPRLTLGVQMVQQLREWGLQRV